MIEVLPCAAVRLSSHAASPSLSQAVPQFSCSILHSAQRRQEAMQGQAEKESLAELAPVVLRATSPENRTEAVPPAPATQPKRKRFSISDDIILLRQVVADTPFASGRGALMDAWEALAAKFGKVDGFAKTELKGKAAQAHFTSIIQAHRHWDNKSTSLSGASEDYKERKQLLDEALLLVDEKSREDASKAESKREKILEEETIAKSVRDEAVGRMRKRTDGKDGGSATKKKLKYTVYDLIREDNELEREEKAAERREKLEERRRERDQEREDRCKEREEDRIEREAARAHQLELVKLENEKYAMMLKLAMLNKSGGGSTE